MPSIKHNVEHYLSAAQNFPGSHIVVDRTSKLNLRIIESSYTIISSGTIQFATHEVIDLPSILCMGGQDIMSLGAENAPFSHTTNQYFLNGVSFATTPASFKNMMEPYTTVGFANVPVLQFSEEIICIASYNVFGHFLLQTCLKLLALKILGRLDTSLVVFSGFLPNSFRSMLDALNILPQRFTLVPSASNIVSAKSTGLLLSPIHTVSTPLCNLIVGSQECHDHRYQEGHQLTSSSWLNPRRGLNAKAASLLMQSVLNTPFTYESNTYINRPKKLYLARKPGVHRSLTNRQCVLQLLESKGYQLLFLEDLSICEQLSYLLSCEHLVCDVGSTSCNIWLMPYLQTVIELAVSGSAIPWGPVLGSAIRSYYFVRILGMPVPGTMKRHDGDTSKPAMPQDTDYIINLDELSEALDRVNHR